MLSLAAPNVLSRAVFPQSHQYPNQPDPAEQKHFSSCLTAVSTSCPSTHERGVREEVTVRHTASAQRGGGDFPASTPTFLLAPAHWLQAQPYKDFSPGFGTEIASFLCQLREISDRQEACRPAGASSPRAGGIWDVACRLVQGGEYFMTP